MKKIIFFNLFLLCINLLHSQVSVDLTRSVPLWLDYDISTNQAVLKWIEDTNTSTYSLFDLTYNPTQINQFDTANGASTEYSLGTLMPGTIYRYLVQKDTEGRGAITVGLQIPVVHQRGRCLIAIDDILSTPLTVEIEQLISDMEMDGWEVETLNIARTTDVSTIKSMITAWYDTSYENSQTLFILGHISVPYSGNSAIDGHTNDHEGAWPADLFYGEVNGTWSDATVNNTSASRDANKNIPGDGKYDQTSIPSDVEIEVGRVDFYDLPDFALDEIELTREYLNKNHTFKTGNNEYPRRALIENNFSNFEEGFGQSGWRNFTTMFTGENVSVENYDVVLQNEKYLCSYACGAGSYTSASGIGSTSTLWVSKDIKTVFTMTFGSYFGDWDSTNNFLRGALASGDVLTNCWAGRPVWQIYDMALGKHIGYSTKITQNASNAIYNQGFGSRNTHTALMGDPTLRLHTMQRASNLTANFDSENINLSWDDSLDANNGYMVYRKINDGQWETLAEFHTMNTFSDECIASNTNYEYMVKAIRLELTGSGSYYNTSLGITTNITSSQVVSSGNCDNSTLNTNEVSDLGISIFPNPVNDKLFIENTYTQALTFRVYNMQGQELKTGLLTKSIDVSSLKSGLYFIEISLPNSKKHMQKKIIVIH